MRVVGIDLLAAFLRRSTLEADDERVRAWLAEMTGKRWASLEDLLIDFRAADISEAPAVSFVLGDGGPTIRTLIDFRPRVVLVTEVLPRSGAEVVTQ